MVICSEGAELRKMECTKMPSDRNVILFLKRDWRINIFKMHAFLEIISQGLSKNQQELQEFISHCLVVQSVADSCSLL